MVNVKPKVKDFGGNLRVAPPPLFLNKPSSDDEKVTNNFDTSFEDLEAIPSTEHQRLMLSNAEGRVEVIKGNNSPCYYMQLQVDFKVHGARGRLLEVDLDTSNPQIFKDFHIQPDGYHLVTSVEISSTKETEIPCIGLKSQLAWLSAYMVEMSSCIIYSALGDCIYDFDLKWICNLLDS